MDRLLRTRSTARGWLTRTSKALEGIIGKPDVSICELSNSLKDFNSRLCHLDEVQGQIEIEINETALEETIEEAFNYRQKLLEIRSKAETKLQTLEHVIDNDKISCASNNSDKSRNGLHHARLPKLEMPKFSGDYLEFTSFYDKFTAIVDGGDLPTVTRFT